MYSMAWERQQICLNDLVEMKKPHPCGSKLWTVTRTGADIKIRCQGCGRIVMLDRAVYLKRLKRIVVPSPERSIDNDTSPNK